MEKFVYIEDKELFAEECTEVLRKGERSLFISKVIMPYEYRATAISCYANFSGYRKHSVISGNVLSKAGL
jgi:hypothetical protein